jgi:hypothetical protein
MTPVQIRLGGQIQEVPLLLPKSFAARRALIACGMEITTSTADRVAAAALGLCWGHPKTKLRANFQAVAFDVLAFGGQVLDDLGEKGWDLDDVCLAGLEAWRGVRASLVSPASTEEKPRSAVEDVKDLADFTPPQQATGTPSESSSEFSGLVT